jgi:DNA anti-recombination protein RmuC
MLVLAIGIFCAVFFFNFRKWRDKFANDHTMRLNSLKKEILNDVYSNTNGELQNIVLELKNVYTAQCAALAKSNAALASELRKLSREKENAHPVAPELVEESLNKLIGEFAKLRNALSSHPANAAETAAIEKLNDVSDALEIEIRKTWENINETLTRNAKDLSASYERFFDLCKTLSLAAAKEKPE